MIPMFAVFGFRTRRQHVFRIWFPIFLIWLLLLPLVLVLLPFFVIACLVLGVRVVRAVATGWQVVASLGGTNIEVQDPEHYVLIRLM